MVRIIGNAVSKYAQEHNQIPYAEQWSNVIIENSPGISTNDFKIPQFNRVDCAVALNQYLSGADVNELPGNVVLLFEADGLMNLTGDSELLLSTREKDAYFGSLLAEDRFAYIYFVDGTIAKFRLHDGGIAIYSRSTGKFGPYVTKGSKYIPLIWKTRF